MLGYLLLVFSYMVEKIIWTHRVLENCLVELMAADY